MSLLTHNDSKKLDLESYVDQIRVYMSKLKPINTREQSGVKYVPEDLSNCAHVWIRCEKIKALLRPLF